MLKQNLILSLKKMFFNVALEDPVVLYEYLNLYLHRIVKLG